MGVDIFTLLLANATILTVTAFAFFAAWQGQRQEVYWQSWIVANLTFTAALFFLMMPPSAQNNLAIALANGLLVFGFGFRWRAARQFAGRSSPLLPIFAPTLFTAVLFALPSVFDFASVYISVNVVLAAAAGFEFWRDRQDALPSRYGLVLAYGLIAVSFASRAGQGLMLGSGLTSYLPQDTMLQIHLLVALLHTTGSGAFALSIAYGRRAVALREVALRDPLTGLYNRRAFEMRLQGHLANGSRDFAVVIFDIDHFKEVNDRYGHAAGDAALCVCAETIARTLRPVDFVARIGGEEFAAILPEISARRALEVTDHVRRVVGAQDINRHGHRFGITLSGGVVHSAAAARDMDSLMQAADTGLYRAKNRGRNRIEPIAA